MIKKLLSALVLLLTVCCVNAQNVNIPDPIFKNFLVNHYYNTSPMIGGVNVYLDSNFDGEIQYSEAALYTSDIYNHAFFLQGLNISDLTGIEAFKEIEWLQISDNPLTSLDIEGCSSLKKLTAYNNQFASLNLVNPSLQELIMSCPTMTTLDLSACPQLKIINCSNNPILTQVNVDGCSLIEELMVYQNPMLTALDLGSHYEMTLFQVTGCQLTDIDLSSAHSLQNLYLNGNPLTSLNLANGNPQSFEQIIATGFPDLTCIKVNNVAVSEYLWTQTGGNYQFDEWVNFSTDCSPPAPCTVAIPDANFKLKLVENTAINTNGNSEIECTEAEAYAGAINVDNANIADMTGVKAFINITAFSCNGTSEQLTSLDVSGMTNLTSISCLLNIQLSNINASGCTALTSINFMPWVPLSLNLNGCTAFTDLSVNNRSLSTLDIRNCTALTNLACNNNQLEALNLEGCTSLQTLNCSNNNIASLLLNTNTLLSDLNCSFNALPSLNVIENNNLIKLNCSNNDLPYLLVSNTPNLTHLDCSENNISYLDVNNNLSLSDLNCSHNNLNALNVSSCAALLNFNCSYNNITSENTSLNPLLSFYDCSHNNISSLDLSSNPALISLYCTDNNLPTLNVNSNINLKYFSCANNDLPTIDLSGNAALLTFNCSYNQLTALDLSAAHLLTVLTCSGNQFTDLDLRETHCLLLTCDNNQLESLNMANGYNVNTIGIVANNNTALTCVQVDDAAFSTTNWTGDNFVFDPGVGFNENCALGIGETSNNAFSVYPNPTSNFIYFSKLSNIRVYNIAGQKLAEKQGVETFDFSSHPSGFYLITFLDDRGHVIQQNKIAKN
jgi:Leucine-rich repeat (LRR) protein